MIFGGFYTNDDEPKRRNTILKAVDGEKQEYTSVCYNPSVEWPSLELGEKEHEERVTKTGKEFREFIATYSKGCY